MAGIKIDFDALKKEHWTAEDTKKANLVVDFIQHLMNDHDFEYMKKTFGQNQYIQHNQSMVNGIDGEEAVLGTIRKLIKRFPEYTYDVKHLYADGSFVIAHSHLTLYKKDRGNPKRGLNIIDKWRMEDGQIVEHWDAIQPIDRFMRFYNWVFGGGFKNTNTYF